jgi:pimeloyl-ACP methyl ester carboxylesterase
LTVTETEVSVGERVLRVRDVGDPEGHPIVFFHGTPRSRLDISFADDIAAESGVRLVSFDRPGYGGSTPAQFGLVSLAKNVAAMADQLEIDRFATMGHSGGSPFALAAAVVLPDRVTRVGVGSGPGPFALVPGGLEQLDNDDTAALALMPGDPAGAARIYAKGFEPRITSFREAQAGELMVEMFGDRLSPRDRELLSDERLATIAGHSMKEALRQGVTGGAWDNVAWVGPWEVDLTTIGCPVLLWFGDDDRLAPLAHGVWLHENIPRSELVVRNGEGHFGFMEHAAEMFSALTAHST